MSGETRLREEGDDIEFLHHSLPARFRLPVSSRIDYKLAVTAFRAKHGLAPDYINELALPHSVSRTLRSTGANLLYVPKSNIVKGDRAFYDCWA